MIEVLKIIKEMVSNLGNDNGYSGWEKLEEDRDEIVNLIKDHIERLNKDLIKIDVDNNYFVEKANEFLNREEV